MRIALLTAGGYPYHRDPLSALCRHLVDGLDRHTFHLFSLTDRARRQAPAYRLPPHVAAARAIDLTAADRAAGPARDHQATTAAILMCRGLLGENGPNAAMFAAGLRRLTAAAARTPDPLRAAPVAEILLDAWRASRAPAESAGHRLPLPRLSLREASYAAVLLQRATRPLAVRLPRSDLVHCVGGTTAVLAALAHRWRTGAPLLLTEARIALPDRPDEGHLPPVVRLLLRRFRSAVAEIGYAQAGMVATLTTQHRDRALQHGADPTRVVVVPAAADPLRCTAVPEHSARPSLVCTGVDTGPGLDLLLDAFSLVLAAVPGAVLHMIGTERESGQLHTQQHVVRDAGLGAAVRISAPPADRLPHYADAQVVVHLSGIAHPPHRLAEAMMCGRAVVATDAAAAAETVGPSGITVPAGDPEALAAACVDLLRRHDLRARLGADARHRALAHFAPDRSVRAYQALYEDVTAPPTRAVPRHEFDLAVPAPRAPVPATIAWLGLEDQ